MNAFPTLRQIDHPHGSFVTNESGMTLRDYFAANAMQAILPLSNYATVAKNSYAIADAMMKARDNNNG